jgi:hypothetical protein
MLTDEQVDHYQTFGFVVLPGWLDEPQAAELGQELDRGCVTATAPISATARPATTSSGGGSR